MCPANANRRQTPLEYQTAPMLTKHDALRLRAEPLTVTTVGQPDFTVSRLHGEFFIIHAVRTRIPVCGTVVRHGPDGFSTPHPSSDLDWRCAQRALSRCRTRNWDGTLTVTRTTGIKERIKPLTMTRTRARIMRRGEEASKGIKVRGKKWDARCWDD